MDRKIEKKRFTPKKIATFGIPTIFIAAVLYMIIFGDKSSKLNVESEKITISEVVRGEFQEYIPAQGIVLPIETRILSAIEGGMVEKRIIEAGAMVKIGDPIVKLSNTNLVMELLNNEANVNRASNEMRNVNLQMAQNALKLKRQRAALRRDLTTQKRDYEAKKKLFEQNLNSREEYEIAKDNYEYSQESMDLTLESMHQDSIFRLNQIQQLETSLSQMQKNLEIVRRRKDNLTVRAPLSGLLASLDAEIGANKGRGQAIGQMDVIDSYKVRCRIDEHYISRIEIGRTGTFDFAGKTFRLVVKKIFPEVREGRFDVDMLFDDLVPTSIRRGQTYHIRLELGDLEEAVLLARGGFYQKTGGQYVYVVDPSGGFAVKRNIRLGRYNPQVYTVLDGLEPGERVITSQYESYNDIDKLIIKGKNKKKSS